MKQDLLEIKNLSLCRSGRVLLKDVSFSLSSGERVSLLGPNGAGKSTLLKCISGNEKCFSGSIVFKGKELSRWKTRVLARELAYMPQVFEPAFSQSVVEFVKMARYSVSESWFGYTKLDTEIADQSLDRCGLSDFAERDVLELSGGERQRVHLAALLAQQSNLLLLDEPATFLDPRHQDACENIVASIHENASVSSLSVTHDINRAAIVAQRIIAMKAGSIVFDGVPKDFMQENVLDEIFEKKFRCIEVAEFPFKLVLPQ